MEWKQIKSAPKDGTLVRLKRVVGSWLVSEGDGWFGDVTINYEDGESCTYRGVWIRRTAEGDKLFPTPTHWLPAAGRVTSVDDGREANPAPENMNEQSID